MTTKFAIRRRSAVTLMVAVLAAAAAPALAQQSTTIRLILKDHKFEPSEARAPAGKPVTLIIRNDDITPAEFESKPLRLEKVIPGGREITLQIRPLPPGRYRFFDDYHENTSAAFLVIE